MVSIVEVTTKAQLRRFVDYPNQLYKDVPQFVPATYGDDLANWDRSKNPAFSYCDARCWLAELDGEIVRRLSEIEEALAWLPAREQVMLRLRYIDGLAIDTICRKMGYSRRQIDRIRDNALRIMVRQRQLTA